jgi:transmembrane 9 superfamily protein 2/4
MGHAFYLPGVAPRTFRYGDRVELKVNKMTSVHTQVPYDYYALKFCKPRSGVQQAQENLGEFLTGDRIENSPYQLFMEQDQFCNILCMEHIKSHDVQAFKAIIKEEYHHNWIIDNLPAASILDSEQYITTTYAGGFPVGYQDGSKTYIFNHVNIIVEYHPLDDGSRVVGFYVEPFTVKHRFVNDQGWDGEDIRTAPPLSTCDKSGPMVFESISEKQEVKPGRILFTYDVMWRASNVKWASRWDIYLTMDNAVPDKVHWFSIINSMLIVMFLSVMIVMIMVRNLHRDITRYNRVLTEDEKNEEREESGWKLVHGDVFRPPTPFPMVFSVLCGTGVQLLCMGFATIIFAAVGFLSPANRGSLVIAVLVLYVMMGSMSGYTSARLYKTFKGKEWQKCTTYTAFLFPGVCFALFLFFNVVLSSYHSTGAIPFMSLAALIALWFGISVPLVFLGAYFGYKQQPLEYPTKQANVIPRTIPEQPWYLSTTFTVLVGGILPFGACFVEFFFILSSMWMNSYYYVFGFTLLVFLILIVTCAEITVVLCYFQLCSEDYHWWWRAFLTSGSTALYVFLYSAIYFSRLEPDMWVTYLLYFGYMGMLSLSIFLVTGSVGFLSCLWFTKKIYGSIKVD